MPGRKTFIDTIVATVAGGGLPSASDNAGRLGVLTDDAGLLTLWRSNGTAWLRVGAPAPTADLEDAIRRAGIKGDGVVTGCAVTAQGSPNMTVAVAVGRVRIAGTDHPVTAGNVTIATADITYPRLDLVGWDTVSGRLTVTGAVSAVPVPPAVPAGVVVLAMVYVPANDTAINTNQITDKRVELHSLTSLTGTFAEQLTLGGSPSNRGMLYRVTDLPGGDSLWRSDGSTWTQVTPPTTAGLATTRSLLPTAGTGATFETCSRITANSAALAAGTTGQLRMVAIWLPINAVVTSISFLIGSTALVTGSHSWVAFFSGARVLLRQSTNNTSPVAAAGTVVTFTLSSPYTTTTTGLFYLGVMWVATTMPTLNGMNNSAIGNGLAPILGGTSDGSLTTTAPSTAAAITAIAGMPYAYVS